MANVETYTYLKETYLSRRPKSDTAIVGLLGVGVLTLASLVYWTDLFGLAAFMPAIRQEIYVNNEYWRLLTAIGAHADFKHLLSNALGFGFFGFLLYDYFGFWVFPVLATLLGVLTNAISILTYPPETRLVGASGMVYAMVGFWLIQYAFIERRHKTGARFLRLMGFALAVLMPTTLEGNVSYRTHGIGVALGAGLGLLYFLVNRQRFRKAEVYVTEVYDPAVEENF